MHSGFANLRSALPMNLKGASRATRCGPARTPTSTASRDLERVHGQYGGPFLFGERRCMADAMYAPVVTRFLTYHVKLDRTSLLYCGRIMAMPEMKEWAAAAKLEPDEIDELDMDF